MLYRKVGQKTSKVCQFRKYKLYHGCFPGNLSEIVTLFLKTWSHFKGINERYQGNEFNYMQQNWSSVLDENIYTQCPISISIFWKGNESDFHTCFYSFQGGHFDLPDRLFHSIKDSWLSAAESNMADVKELIPEFFYLPDFLTNNNHFDLGKCSTF